jgi:hypothetical protein
MNWDNLADSRCPRCSSKLESHGLLADFMTCSEPHCLYKINTEKFAEISGRMKARRDTLRDPDENLAALNNL